MVSKIGQSLLNAHGGMEGGSQAPSLSLIFRANTVGPIQNLFGIIIIITALTTEKKNQFGVGLDPPSPPHCWPSES